uniref:Uncharacterized protein n=1 Tax=Magallana gigas TaxID=29159 RepID=A0A8W8MRR9_MAGGI
MNFKKSRHGKSVTRPLVGKSKADYDVMPEANNDTEACIQKTLLASLKDAIPNACVFKGMHTTDDQDTTQLPVPVNQKETADVMAFDVSNYYIDNMVKNNVEHVTETEVQAINNLTMGKSDETINSTLLSQRSFVSKHRYHPYFCESPSVKSTQNLFSIVQIDRDSRSVSTREQCLLPCDARFCRGSPSTK